MSGFTRGATGLADRLGLDRPTVVIDRDRVGGNLERMAAKAARAGVRLRPHVKTHQSPAIARRLRDFGIDAITVSDPDMADRFADDGWRDITLARPVSPREIGRLRPGLDLVVHHAEQAAALADAGVKAGVWIKTDCGYGRSGYRWNDEPHLVEVARAIDAADGLERRGLLTHAGHSYDAAGPNAVRAIHAVAVERMGRAREAVGDPCEISIGDTPGCSLAEDFVGVDEIRPGNFIFHDLMQLRLGACGPEDLAAGLLCPVIGRDLERERLIVHGGAVHLSADRLAGGDAWLFGCAAEVTDGRIGKLREDLPLVGLSQEHGVLRVPREQLETVGLGDVVLVMPIHSCLMCDLHERLLEI